MRTAHCILAISILVSLAAVPAGAQIIGVDPTAASGSNSGTTVTWMHTVGNGTNRILVVGLASATANPFPTATSVTYGGQSLTRQVVSTQLGAPNIEIWTLIAPPSGTAQITATFPQSATIAGGSVSFSRVDQGTPIRATNNARALGIGVTVATAVATNFGDVVIDAVAAAGTGASGSPGIGQTLQWSGSTSGTLFGGGSIKPGATGATIMSWNLSGGSPSVSGDIAAISLIPVQGADISVTKSGPATATAGNNVTYTLTITNNSPNQATGVTVTDPTPANLTFVSNSGACTNAFPCNLGTLNGNQSATITSTYTISPSFSGSVTNTATVSSTDPPDPNSNNNSSSATTTVTTSADLSITKTVTTPVVGGQNTTYTITVTNNGPSQATGVTVNDIAPPGFTFVSNTGSCTTAFPCNLGTLSKGQSVTIQATFTVPSNFQGSSNTATVSSTTPDPNSANNTATVSNGPPATPLPSTLLLMCVGLAALAIWNRRKLLRLRRL